MAANADPRHAGLTAAARRFLTEGALHPDPDTYLAHGYVDLCLGAWRGSSGERLELATQWALWMWLADDVLDQELREADSRIIRALVGRVADVLDGEELEDVDHPITHRLADLVQRTQPVMPRDWWGRYASEMDAWLRAAADKLESFVQPARTPSLRQYLLLRPIDGGMVLAAMWTELALECVAPDWGGPLMHRLLEAFSAVGTLTNDLAASSSDTFTAQAALVRSGLSLEAARLCVAEQLEAEARRFDFFLAAIREDAALVDDPLAVSPDTARLANALDGFLGALTDWTRSSSRYVLAGPAEVAE